MPLIDTKYALTFAQLTNNVSLAMQRFKYDGSISTENRYAEVYPLGDMRRYELTGITDVRVVYNGLADYWEKVPYKYGDQNYHYVKTVKYP
jgi:hypothetical protein